MRNGSFFFFVDAILGVEVWQFSCRLMVLKRLFTEREKSATKEAISMLSKVSHFLLC